LSFVVDAGAMRVTFDRLADHEWADVLIERDDRVVYRMHAGPVTAEIPHDLVHFAVEDALGIADGIWAAIAGGVVFRSMTHVSGRRPPHAAERSAELIKQYRDRLQAAELIGGFVESAARVPAADLPRLVAESYRTRPGEEPDLASVAHAVAALHRVEQRWQALPIGGHLTVDWPAHRRVALPPARRPRDKVAGRRRR
jgi:hypothetical protein